MSSKFVVAGGWSVSEYDLDDLCKYGHVIGVNDAALWIPVHTCVTMDRLWFENRWRYLRTKRVAETLVRVKCDCNVKRKDKRDNWQTFTHHHKPGLGVTKGELYGGNSGVCAINHAFQCMEEGDRLFLFGFDMQRGPGNEPYWYPTYPWANPDGGTTGGKFKEWLGQFDAIGKQIRDSRMEIYNVTHRSTIPESAVPKIKLAEMWEMIE